MLVSISRRKGGTLMSLRRAFGPVPFPLLFFTLSMFLRKAFGLSSADCSVLGGLNVARLLSICRCIQGRFMPLGRPSAYYWFHFSSSHCLLQKAVNAVGLVPVCHCKGGRFMSVRKAFHLVTCPLLFFTLSFSCHCSWCFFVKALNVVA